MSRYTLPYDRKIGLPQRVQFTLNGTAYTAYLRRVKNPESTLVQTDGAYTTVRIVRDRDAVEVLTTRLCEFAPVEALDPTTYEVLMTLFPYTLTDDDCIIWVYV